MKKQTQREKNPYPNSDSNKRYQTFDYYMKHFRIKNAVPMHFSGSSKICDDFLANPISRDYKHKILCVEPGGKLTLN